MPAADERSLRHLPELDGLRGLAILLVLFWHYWMMQAWLPDGSFLFLLTIPGRMAWTGVDLFFVLSGFLLGSILIRNRGAENYYSAFYIRRVFRIIPIYAVLLLLYALGGALATPLTNQGTQWLFEGSMPFWTYATFTQNIAMAIDNTLHGHFLSPTWSLAIEEQFYLVLPLLVAMTPPRALPWVLAALIALAPALRGALSPIAAFVLMPARMDALLAGVLLAYAVETPGAHAWLAARLLWVRVLFGMLAGVLALYCVDVLTLGGTLGASVFAGFYALLLALVVLRPGGVLGAFLRARWLTGLGAISYCVYLFHQPVSGALHAFLLGRMPIVDSAISGVVTLAALALTLAFGLFTLRFIERPAIAFGRRLAYGPRGPVRA